MSEVELVRGDTGELELASDVLNPMKLLMESQAEERVYEVFAFLSQVVILHAIEEMTLREIADSLGRRLSEVNRAWKQGRRLLAEHL